MESLHQLMQQVISDHERILTEKADLTSYSYDASFGVYMPEIVVQPLTTAEVSGVIKLANTYKIPVYPRGQGTSLSGGPLPVHGGIVMDLSQWTSTLEVDQKIC